MKAYLQNKDAAYYYIADNGIVALSKEKKALQYFPETMESVEQLQSAGGKFFSYEQTGYTFRNDGLRILSYIFFRKGKAGDCFLTIEDNDAGGELDFSTARIKGNREISICCIHF